jgi:hypoxanthine-DNA glycosylase
VVVLGTMPSAASLRAQQYYAHPQNLFWKLLGAALGCELPADYTARSARVQQAGIAIWDVLQACTRPGSLDADILASSAVANDFAGFFERHPKIGRVFFNGATAEALYRRHVLPSLPRALALDYARLPSSSPANASIPIAKKLRAWSALAPPKS